MQKFLDLLSTSQIQVVQNTAMANTVVIATANIRTATATAHTVHTEAMAVTADTDTAHTVTADTDTDTVQEADMTHMATADMATAFLRMTHNRTEDNYCGSKGHKINDYRKSCGNTLSYYSGNR